MFQPSEETAATVRDWLIAFGIAEHRIVQSDNKGWLAFDGTAKEVESLLKAEYHTYEHSSGDRVAVACDE